MAESKGKVYLVPTPIGNLSDLSPRSLEILQSVAVVACEDTRTTGSLLAKFEFKQKLVSYHEFNERQRAAQLLGELEQGRDIAVVSDAGAPGISDPAYRIVRLAIDHGAEVIALPGPCAIIPALTASGLPTDRFFYEGFLSNKSAARRKRLAALSEFEHTLVFYESPHRIHKMLGDALTELGDRQACVAREISKKFEQYFRGTISQILSQIEGHNVKGEIVVVISGAGLERRKQHD